MGKYVRIICLILIVVIFYFLFQIREAKATTYYVDAVDGNNSWDGLASEWTSGTNGPWKTMAQVTAFSFSAGDTCLFKRGSSYGYLKPGVSGTSGNHIVFGAYGDQDLGNASFTGVDGNGKSYITCTGLYFSGDRLWLDSSETDWTFNYCFIGNNSSAGLWGANCTNIIFNNCLFARNANYHINTSGTSSVQARNCIFVGTTGTSGAFNIQAGGSLDLDYSLIMGNTSNITTNASTTNVVDGGHNQWRLWPSFKTMPFTDAPRAAFSFDDNAAINSFETMANGIFDTYGVNATIYINPGIWTAGEITKLLDFISKGHEVANHTWSHEDLIATEAFVVTSTNTNPTVDVDVATTTITLSCDEAGNIVAFDWSGDKTIADLEAAVTGKGWTITNSTQNGKTRTDYLKLDSLADSSGAQACPYTTLLDVSAPNYKFWDHQINDAQDAIEDTLGVRPVTLAYPYGFNNAALKAWIDANTDLKVARIVGGTPFNLASVPMWIFQGGGITNPTTITEAETYEYADHMMYWMESTPGYLSFYTHSASDDEIERIGWFIARTQERGATWSTVRSLIEWIDSTHTVSGTNWINTYTPTPDYHLLSDSPAVNTGTNVGLTEDYEGNAVPRCSGTNPDIGLYEYQETCPTTTGGGSVYGYSNPPIPGLHGFRVIINNGDAYTNNREVTLTLEAGSNVKYVAVSEKKDLSDAGFEAFEPEIFSKKFILTAGDGLKRVYAQFLTAYSRSSDIVYDEIILDTSSSAEQEEQPKEEEQAEVPKNLETAVIVDGDLIRATNGFDVYIVKLIGDKKFKRLILNPDIFNQYKHLKWENIKEVSQEILDQYTTSDLTRALGDTKVFKLYANGDVGVKRWIKTFEDFLSFAYDWDSVYTINDYERDDYSNGKDLIYEPY